MYHQQPHNMQMPYGNMMPDQHSQGQQMGGHHQMPMQQHMQQPMQQSPQEMKEYCEKHMYYFVIIEMQDGSRYDGIIVNIDAENVYVLMPAGDEDESGESSDERQFGYGYGGYGPGYGGYGYPYRFRRFRRYRFPFFGIRSFFFPFFI
ncbi:hypothetical protein ACFFGV_08270 [Pontibacillus salicampi]|uniref:Uncharacterized protein n=1 Tax=Pontibacillus salicampi TaxID=1449801 RepID=A0ABV6LMP2_9BACI